MRFQTLRSRAGRGRGRAETEAAVAWETVAEGAEHLRLLPPLASHGAPPVEAVPAPLHSRTHSAHTLTSPRCRGSGTLAAPGLGVSGLCPTTLVRCLHWLPGSPWPLGSGTAGLASTSPRAGPPHVSVPEAPGLSAFLGHARRARALLGRGA